MRPVKIGLSRSFCGFIFGLTRAWGILLGVPFGPGVLLWDPFWVFFLGLGAKGCQQQLSDASQLAGLELGHNLAGVPAASKLRSPAGWAGISKVARSSRTSLISWLNSHEARGVSGVGARSGGWGLIIGNPRLINKFLSSC